MYITTPLRSNSWVSSITLVFAWTIIFALPQQAFGQRQVVKVAAHNCSDYKVGDIISIQCLDPKTRKWGPAPVCEENMEELSFPFGMDNFFHCSIAISDIPSYEYFKSLILQDENWSCRIKMAADHEYYIPFYIALWGVVEADHLHINNHINFVFHADEGKILGVTSYPLKDKFEFIRPGIRLSLHGAVKWFHKESFDDFSPFRKAHTFHLGTASLIFVWTLVTISLSVVLYRFIYMMFLKPNVVRKGLKKE